MVQYSTSLGMPGAVRYKVAADYVSTLVSTKNLSGVQGTV